MTDHVCTQLAAPDANGVQACLAWAELEPLLPNLTQAETAQICASIATFLAICFILRKLRSAG